MSGDPIMALRSATVRVIAITTVAGNVPVQQARRNALYTAELCGAGGPAQYSTRANTTRRIIRIRAPVGHSMMRSSP